MPKSSREVYKMLSSNSGEPVDAGYIAVGMFESLKNEWIDYIEKRDGAPPTETDINRWIEDLSPSQLEKIKNEAYGWFSISSRILLNDEIEEKKKTAANNSIVETIRSATSGWKSFGIGVASSVLASLLFAILLIAFYWIAVRDPSPMGLANKSGLAPSQTQSGSEIQRPN